MISDEDKERVRQATDIVALVGETVELRQRGHEFWGCCPFHGERTPSFKVNPQTGLWHCFGCGEGGDVFAYVQRRENLGFVDALRYLADRAGIELDEDARSTGPKKSRLMEALGEAEAYYHTMLMRGRGEGPDAARRYLAGRGFGSDVCRRWGLGYAPGRGKLVAHLRSCGFSAAELERADLAVSRSGRFQDRFFERVMFPIHDEVGRTIAFGGRVIERRDGVAKYVNTRDTPAFNKGKHLFAYDRAKEGMAATGTAIVCEGYTDVIAMHEAGLTNTVAALGTAFRLDHVRLMERQRVSRIVCLFDGDAAGQRAAERAVRYIDKTSAELLCVVLPGGQDPMEYLADHGVDAMKEQLAGARPLMDFVFEKRVGGLETASPGRRVQALGEMARVLAPLKDSVLVDGYATRLADALGLEVEAVLRAIREAPVEPLDEERPARGGTGTGAGPGSGSGGRAAGAAGAAGSRGERGAATGRQSVPGAAGTQGRVAGVAATTAPALARDARAATPMAPGPDPTGPSWESAPDGADATPWDYLPPEALDDGAAPVSSGANPGQVAPAAPVSPGTAAQPATPAHPASGAAPSTSPAPAASQPALVSLAALSADDRRQLEAEGELVCAIAADPDALRPEAARIATLWWVDPANESMAWAMLATPEGTTPAAAVAAAAAVVPEAPRLLSGGRAVGGTPEEAARARALVLDTVELCSCRRQVRAARARLQSERVSPDEAERLYREAAAFQERATELAAQLSQASVE